MSLYCCEKKMPTGFALFKSIFLRSRSLSNARWFYGKKHKIGKGNLYSTENWSGGNEIRCAEDNHNYICHTCVKGFLMLMRNLDNYFTISKGHQSDRVDSPKIKLRVLVRRLLSTISWKVCFRSRNKKLQDSSVRSVNKVLFSEFIRHGSRLFPCLKSIWCSLVLVENMAN